MKIINKFSSPNCNLRKEEINYVIIHYTEMDFEGALKRLCDPDSKVSAHYFIKGTGEIYQLVKDEYVAWHAGDSYFQDCQSLNENSIGIELDNFGNHDFSNKQMESLIELCLVLKSKYNIAKENFIGHSDVAPSRKIDPGIFFDWKRLAEHDLGIWHFGLENSKKNLLHSYGNHGDLVRDLQSRLNLLGYFLIISGEYDKDTSDISRAFHAKFLPHRIKNLGVDYYNDLNSVYDWYEDSEEVLDCLLNAIYTPS